MAAADTNTAAVTSGDVAGPRRRGNSKAPNFKYDGPVSVIRLELDASDDRVRQRLERQWTAAFRLRRALQSDAQHRCHAYWAAHHERATDPRALRDRLGLSRESPKTLAQRTHDCPHCGLRADRDVTSAMLAACVTLADPGDPGTARVDYRLARALRTRLASQQEWEGSVNRHQPPAPPDGVGWARTGSRHPVASAEQAALGLPPNSPSRKPGRRGTSRKERPPSCSPLHDPSRVNS
jgi:hypothetical protein